MKSFFLSLLLLSLSFVTQAFDHRHSTWDQVLKSSVYWMNDGKASQVDYNKLSRSTGQLNLYLRELQSVSPQEFNSWTSEQQLAYLINAYNAFTIKFILSEYPNIDSIKDLGSWFKSPWKIEWFELLGAKRSLDEIEHQLIRERFDEMRIHFALVCASVGCPALSDHAYTQENIESQFEQGVRRFLSDSSRNYYDPAKNQLYLSKIFKWYAEDFSPSVKASLIPYADTLGVTKDQLRTSKISYLDYDWSLNDTP